MPTHAIVTTGQPELIAVYGKTVVLNDEEIKALPTTGIELVAAPGANKIIVPIMALLTVDFSAGVYTNIAAATLYFGTPGWWGSLDQTWKDRLASTGLYSSVFNLGFLEAAFEAVTVETSAVNNTGLVIKDEFNGSDYTGGNAANTLTVSVCYLIVDL